MTETLTTNKTGQYVSGKFYSNVKYEAERRGIDFDLTLDYMDGLIRGQKHKCYYSGLPIDAKTRDCITASLDRIDSDKGYTKGNVHFVFKKINMMKWILSEEDFLFLCEQITNHSKEIENVDAFVSNPRLLQAQRFIR